MPFLFVAGAALDEVKGTQELRSILLGTRGGPPKELSYHYEPELNTRGQLNPKVVPPFFHLSQLLVLVKLSACTVRADDHRV
jgi:hypothetical protein